MKIACPNCDNPVASCEGERITMYVDMMRRERQMQRRVITAWRQAEFTCERCGYTWLVVCQPSQESPETAGSAQIVSSVDNAGRQAVE